MEKFLRPERFDAIPNTTGADKAWIHWKRTFNGFVTAIKATDNIKFDMLVNYVSPSVFEYISECEDFTIAMQVLESMFIVPKNEIFARHLLATRQQQSGETLDAYLNALKLLAKDCQFKAVSAEAYRQEMIRDAFINGIQSHNIRQRLLENNTLTLDAAFTQARSLELAQKSSNQYNTDATLNAATINDQQLADLNAISAKRNCFFCGGSRHNRQNCPAKDTVCHNCEKPGHFAKVCQSKRKNPPSKSTSASTHPTLASVLATSKSPKSLQKTILNALVNNNHVNALIDTGSSDSFICKKLVDEFNLTTIPTHSSVSMAESSVTIKVLGYVTVELKINDFVYEKTKLSVLENLCADVIIGQDILAQHERLNVDFGGSRPPFSVCSLSTMNIEPPSLFTGQKPDCKPISIKSRRYSQNDQKFIDGEIQRLLNEDIIEPSNSPWRAQVLVTVNDRHKKRMVIDYSQTINLHTQLDAYPLPRIDDQINELAKNSVFSTIDLKDAYYQIPIRSDERPYFAFEAAGKLYQPKRLPFGVTNGVACFQRNIDDFIKRHSLEKTYAYLDNVTVAGVDQAEHDKNLTTLLDACKKDSLLLNDSKSVLSVSSICLLGYLVSHNEIRPDPARLQPLRDIPLPENLKLQKKTVGLFAYYSKWIPNFSEKIKPLSSNSEFPLPPPAVDAFNLLKKEIEHSVVAAVDETKPFVVETDASDLAIAATLNQEGRPVAFFSRSLSRNEINHSSVEKEACSIVEAIRHWRHYLTGKHFTLVTDQNSVRYMFDKKRQSKIKNEKINRWRVELGCYNFDIQYRPGEENVPADSFSRLFCSAISTDRLYKLHDDLCHPGVTRFHHFLKTKNIAVSLEEVRNVISSCKVCAENKPRFHKPEEKKLIKSTQPFERLSIDFKGPLPSATANKYLLTIVDEYSRFPFAIPCPNIDTETVIQKLSSIFSVFGTPGYIHSDRGSSFMSNNLKSWLHSMNIPTSRTTPYNPAGNGQCERYNQTIWKAINLACSSKNLDIKYWEIVLSDALHAIRSLLCTTTNTTPHERLFNYARRSVSGESLPSWVIPGPVYLKRHVRRSKYDPLVDEVELLEANPNYAHIRHTDGRESTVSLRDIAPCSQPASQSDADKDAPPNRIPETVPINNPPLNAENLNCPQPVPPVIANKNPTNVGPAPASPEIVAPRKSQRVRRPPDRLDL